MLGNKLLIVVSKLSLHPLLKTCTTVKRKEIWDILTTKKIYNNLMLWGSVTLFNILVNESHESFKIKMLSLHPPPLFFLLAYPHPLAVIPSCLHLSIALLFLFVFSTFSCLSSLLLLFFPFACFLLLLLHLLFPLPAFNLAHPSNLLSTSSFSSPPHLPPPPG